MVKRRVKTAKGQLELWSGARIQPEQPCYVPGSWVGKKVHLIGIGGIGMSGIARLLLSEGCIVSGCDVGSSDITRELPQAGISVALGHSPRHLDDNTELVVMSAAVRETNPEVRAAHQRGIQVLKYAQALGCLLADRDGVAVAGSHGKTTTSSMIAYSMNVAGRDPGMVIGGLVPQLGGSACAGGAGPFVVEACEYDRSFLNLRPKTAVITNIDSDHLDYYSGIDELIDAFGRFVSHVGSDGLVVVNGDDPNAMRAATYTPARVETFGATRGCTWRVGEWSRENGMTRFHVYRNNRTWGRFELIVPGLYNVLNATACLAVCTYFGIRKPDLRKALAAFSGVRRRFDRIGEVAGVMVLDDYGHHPTEVRVTLKAVRKDFPSRRLVCVFQPHQCSRTRIFLKEFAKSLTTADCVIVPDIYSVRDTAADQRSVHARDLVAQLRENGVQAEYQAELENVLDQLLADVRQGDLVMTMGAGPVDGVGRRLLAELRKRETSNELVLRS